MLMALSSFIFLFCSLISLSLLFKSCNADDTHQLTFDETITPGESLVSPNQRFVLGFFSPSNYSNMSYLGIWYKKFPQVVVWVANRETPLTDSYGTLKIAKNGNLVLLNSTNNLIWSSNYSKPAQNSVLQLLDSGNLVLRENGNTNTESQIWQSFDFPGDTLLPGMKIGLDRTTGEARKLTSWKDFTDPSPGIFSYKMELLGLPQLVLRRGTKEKFRTGVWNGLRFSGRYISINSSTVYNYIYANNSREIYFAYEFTNNPTITRVTLNPAGLLKRYTYTEGSSDWELSYVTPGDNCDDYGFCGANGFCKSEKAPSCECLQGFIPKSLEEWNAIDGSGGCVRRTPLDCQKGDGFLKIKNVKLPDLLVREFWLNKSMNLKECETECLKNCNCTAYANSDISGRGSGCLIWFGDLIDTREFVAPGSEQDLYVRLAASELDHKRIKMVMFVAISTVAVILVLISFLIWHKIHKNKKRRETNREDREIPLFDLATMASATNNFSGAKMIGKGGFGSVYKGKLSTGQEIAVKRLSLQDSERGLQEFKNEMILISKLQHRNLVRLVGCCLEGKERLLVYEYMPNQSLDYFIFDKSKAVLLKWEYRLEIAMGIAKGLMYLHQDSRLRIIHRDLKASNVLLDSELNAKISDFGIARIFGGDQNEAKTKRVIGTYGYMSPEYAIDGKFSEKSDVFSFGVILLEIISGKRNNNYQNADDYHNLLGHVSRYDDDKKAWILWNEGRAMELMATCLENSCKEAQVLRCIHVSLLCLQKFPKDRPAMSLVVSMLGNEDVKLPKPKQPGFFFERCSIQEVVNSEERRTSENELTITVLEAR